MLIRDITEKDVEQIYEIELEAFSSPWSRESILMEVISSKSRYLVVDVEGEILGYAGLWKIFDEGHVTNIAVKKGYRHKGLGRAMMEQLISDTKCEGVGSFTLEVRASNVGALKLYRSLEFEEAGRRKNFYEKPREDAIIMWKRN